MDGRFGPGPGPPRRGPRGGCLPPAAGPLAGRVLAGLGARVVKIEDRVFRDPFVHGLFAEMDGSFPLWYGELNGRKEVRRLDFKDPRGAEEARGLVRGADAVIMGLPPRTRARLGLDEGWLRSLGRPLAVVGMAVSKGGGRGSMHDLNVLAATGLLRLHVHGRTEAVVEPPFLPVAGAAFGAAVATEVLAALVAAGRTGGAVFRTAHLEEATEELLGPLWPKALRAEGPRRFLHSGLYPCYCLYRLADGRYAALAAVEEKFWTAFCGALGLSIDPGRRFFHGDRSVFDEVAGALGALSSGEVRERVRGVDCCLTLV